MAAFTRADPFDRGAFDAHYERVRGGTDTGFAPGVGAEVVEHIYRLDQ